ncbi:MAG: DUF2461 domain-containing protein [Bacteroidales bacterium]|nr:DUF2461 domain-containing protein [Bacteroidales bacterium]
MKRVYDFLAALSRNNNKVWFDAHKDRYLEAKKIFDDFTAELIEEVAKWDEYVSASKPTVRQSTYRIYRDLRFSRDKSPYKTHMGAFVVPGGKKSPYCGYYFHLEPPQKKGLIGGNMLFVGLYQPDPKIIASFRDEVSVNGDPFLEAVEKAKGFGLYTEGMTRKVPAGFENVEKEEWKELLRMKDVNLTMAMDEKFLFAPNLAKRVAARLKRCKDFSFILNRCVDYALEGNL